MIEVMAYRDDRNQMRLMVLGDETHLTDKMKLRAYLRLAQLEYIEANGQEHEGLRDELQELDNLLK